MFANVPKILPCLDLLVTSTKVVWRKKIVICVYEASDYMIMQQRALRDDDEDVLDILAQSYTYLPPPEAWYAHKMNQPKFQLRMSFQSEKRATKLATTAWAAARAKFYNRLGYAQT